MCKLCLVYVVLACDANKQFKLEPNCDTSRLMPFSRRQLNNSNTMQNIANPLPCARNPDPSQEHPKANAGGVWKSSKQWVVKIEKPLEDEPAQQDDSMHFTWTSSFRLGTSSELPSQGRKRWCPAFLFVSLGPFLALPKSLLDTSLSVQEEKHRENNNWRWTAEIILSRDGCYRVQQHETQSWHKLTFELTFESTSVLGVIVQLKTRLDLSSVAFHAEKTQILPSLESVLSWTSVAGLPIQSEEPAALKLHLSDEFRWRAPWTWQQINT